MKRFLDNLSIDLVAALLMVGMLATGYILRFPLPPGTNKSLTLWGRTRHEWGDIHFWISLALLGVVLLHVGLHWPWLVTMLSRRLHLRAATAGRRLAAGLATLLAVAAAGILFGWAAQSSVREISALRPDVCPPDEAAPDDQRTNATHRAVRAEPRAGGASAPAHFWRDVYPVLAASCLSCHGPKRQSGGFRVDHRDDFFARDGRQPFIVPGSSSRSPLIAVVSGGRKDMPLANRHRLPEREVALLKAWIDGGAEWPERPQRP
jgi:hypothetical protein